MSDIRRATQVDVVNFLEKELFRTYPVEDEMCHLAWNMWVDIKNRILANKYQESLVIEDYKELEELAEKLADKQVSRLDAEKWERVKAEQLQQLIYMYVLRFEPEPIVTPRSKNIKLLVLEVVLVIIGGGLGYVLGAAFGL